VKPYLFDNEIHRTIATRVMAYWDQHERAPGPAHTPDLVADILEDPENRRADAYRSVLNNMLALHDDKQLNPQYVIDQLQTFLRLQQAKHLIIESADKLTEKQQLALPEVQQKWANFLRSDPNPPLDDAVRLGDIDSFVREFEHYNRREFTSGIPLLDHHYVVPTRGLLSLLLGTVSSGKSWYLVHLGRRALMQAQKVLHVTLELPTREVRARYHQNFCAVAKYQSYLTTPITTLTTTPGMPDGHKHLTGFGHDQLTAKFCLQDAGLGSKLKNFHRTRLAMLNNLVIKQFPAQTLTVPQLHGYLDQLQLTHGFVPDLLLVDYLGLLKTGSDNHRIDLGRQVVELRGLASARNLAVVSVHQLNREAQKLKTVTSEHVAEDFSMIATADYVLVLNRSKLEQPHKLARLWVEKAREGEAHFGVVLAQNYQHGQFVVNSAPLGDADRYWRMVEGLTHPGSG
jgi:hypothetical protein